MVLHPVDPSSHFRERRRKQQQRRRRRIRRNIATVLLVLLAAAVASAARVIRDDAEANAPSERAAQVTGERKTPRPVAHVQQPPVIRGVHVTMALASIPGKLDEYLALPGLNTLQLDVKDENGEVGFVPSAVPLARELGAAKPYYRPREVARKVHAEGIYLIGRIVVMEDPVLSLRRPDLAIRTAGGGRWVNHAGLGWANPYDKRVWEYNVDLAEAAARTGFDEIQFDYVRFPTDGDVSAMVFPVETDTPRNWVIPEFVHYAAKRLKPLGVKVSADVFGLAATRDLGIGQLPSRLARHLDAIYPMVYPSHFGPGEYGIADPNGDPGATVAYALRDFNEQLAGTKVRVIPWLQDFSWGRAYGLPELQAQIDSARRAKAGGYLLWNAAGVYTRGALQPARWRGE